MTGNIFKRLAADQNARQFAVFAAVGVTATAVQYVILIMLVELAHQRSVTSAVLAYLCGALVSYLLNARFTFGEARISFGRPLIKFLIVNMIGLGLNTLIFIAFVNVHVHYLTAQIAATGLVLLWNYAGARLFVFRS